MSDESTPPAPVVHEGMSKEEAKILLDQHKLEVERMFEDHKEKLTNELGTLGAGDREEREQLKHDMSELKEWRKEQLKAIEKAEEVKGDAHTIVTPPTNIPPPPSPSEPSSGGDSGAGPERKRGWHTLW